MRLPSSRRPVRDRERERPRAFVRREEPPPPIGLEPVRSEEQNTGRGEEAGVPGRERPARHAKCRPARTDSPIPRAPDPTESASRPMREPTRPARRLRAAGDDPKQARASPRVSRFSRAAIRHSAGADEVWRWMRVPVSVPSALREAAEGDESDDGEDDPEPDAPDDRYHDAGDDENASQAEAGGTRSCVPAMSPFVSLMR